MDLQTVHDPVGWLQDLYGQHGASQYGGERLSQMEHALQCAWLAEQEGRADPLIAAALLHDVGHLVHKFGKDPAARGIDDRHESIGAQVLARWFGAALIEPIRLHVSAKRYLCAIEPAYAVQLSFASQRSLELQGGVYSAADAAAFQALPFAEDAIALRRWDEAAKVQGAETPDFAHFVPMIRAGLLPA
jgi:[1-hydroxy-2-(trimethylamino)ethyl]phosphonate dioxygenase